MGTAPIRNNSSLAQLLRRPELAFADLTTFCPELAGVPSDVALQVEVSIKYSGYVDRQAQGLKRFQKMENVSLPDDLDYGQIHGLSREIKEKLTFVRPRSLGQAYRISGVTPAAISALSLYLYKMKAG